MRTAIYARVSTQEQAQKLAPIADQLAECRQRCAERGWDVALQAVDDGISGSVWPRPGLASLLDAARRGEFDLLLCWNYQRVGRDENLELFGHLMWEFRQAGVRVVSVKEEGATPIETNVHGMVAGLQLQKIREDITRAMRSKASRCEYTGGRRLFGYRWTGKAAREIVPEEAAVVARAFEMADPEGEHRHLAEISRELGLELQRVRRLLRHPGYAGAYTYSRTTLSGGRNRMARPAPPDRRVITWGAHEPIVPRELWDRVQERLDDQASVRPNNRGQASLPLTGILACGLCGSTLRVTGSHRGPDGVNRYYYKCLTEDCAGVGNLAVHGWAQQIIRSILEQLRRPDLAKAISDQLNSVYQAGRRAGSWDAEIRRLEKAEAILREMIRSGEIEDTRALIRDYDATTRALGRARAAQAHERSRASGMTSPRSIQARLAHACEALRKVDGELPWEPDLDRAVRPVLARFVESIAVRPDSAIADVTLRSDAMMADGKSNTDGGRMNQLKVVLSSPGKQACKSLVRHAREVLAEECRPMRTQELRERIEMRAGRPVSRATLFTELWRHERLIQRVERGLWALRPHPLWNSRAPASPPGAHRKCLRLLRPDVSCRQPARSSTNRSDGGGLRRPGRPK